MVEEKREKRGRAEAIQEAEEKKEERRPEVTDFGELATFYKRSYLEGLEMALRGQEEMEKLMREATKPGFAMWNEWLRHSRQWVQALPEITGGDTGVPNPWLTWSKECTETACGAADLLLRATEELFNSGFSLYEKVAAQPIRKHTRELNKQWMEVMIQG